MAYTYDDFLKVANNAKMLNQFDSKDLEVTKANPEYGLSMLRLMQDRNNAASPESRLLAGEAIRQLRNNYNVSALGLGGITSPEMDLKDNGSASDPVTESTGEGFQYEREDQYQILLDQITNPPAFQYDPQQDPAWSAYRKQYLREGQRATQDALTRASLATGGVPSSYAVTAAQQAGANYAEGLADVLPTLEQQAYARYLQDLGIRQDAFSALNADRADAYGKWIDEYNMLLKNIEPSKGDNKENMTGLSEDDLAFLKDTFPTGTIQNKEDWDLLVEWYGEDALRAAGYSFVPDTDKLGSPALGILLGGALPGGIVQPGVLPNPDGSVWDGSTITGVDIDTLSSLGYSDYPEEALAVLVNAGMLKEEVVDGVMRWVLGPNNLGADGKAKYTPEQALKMALFGAV